jgi:hypothetical protein
MVVAEEVFKVGGLMGMRGRCGSGVLCEKTGHVVEDCWYQYPEKAPASFKPMKSTQGLVAANLKADPSLGGGSKKVKQS